MIGKLLRKLFKRQDKSERRENAAVERTIKAIAKVINHSRTNVHMVSGALAHEVYQNQRIQDVIKKALERGVNFYIIVGPDYDKESSFILDILRNAIYVAPEWPERHFTVGDRRHLRYEPDGHENEGFPQADNMTALDMLDAAQFLVERFYELKETCAPLVERVLKNNEEISRAGFLKEGIIEQLEEHTPNTLGNLEATLKRGLEGIEAERKRLAILAKPLP